MNRAYEKVNLFIERHSMLASSSGVVVAVSGGPDSVALLDMLVRLLGARERENTEKNTNDRSSESSLQPLASSPFIHVAHFDHQLREDSIDDARFVERLAQSLNLAFTLGAADVRAEAEKAGRGIEETARELRYNFLLETARAAGCDRIATGHTMSDQAETFLMRLARGAGLRGLAAMRSVVPAHAFEREEASGGRQEAGSSRQEAGGSEIKKNEEELPPASCLLPTVLLIRPMLCITREEVEEYCRERGLEFRTDATNESVLYTRNRVRLEVLPALRQVNSGVVENIARAAEIINEAEEALGYAAGAFLDKAQAGSATGTNKSNVRVEVAAYSVKELLAQPVGLRRRVMLEAINRARRVDTIQSEERPQITSAHVDLVEKLFGEKASGNRVELPGGIEVWREFEAIVIKSSAIKSSAQAAAVEQSHQEQEISAEHRSVDAGGITLLIERGVGGELLGEMIEQARREKEQTGRDWRFAVLDDALLPERLVVRARRAGETAHIVGRRRTLKLKNLMIGHKIPASRRNTWPVIATPEGRYVWSPGLPPAAEFAASDSSEKLAILRASGF